MLYLCVSLGTDLKTVHQRGLGTIRFFRHTFTFTPPQAHKTCYIKADIVDGEPERPFIQVVEQSHYNSINEGGYELVSGATEVEIQIYMNRAISTTLEIISTSELENVRFDHVG